MKKTFTLCIISLGMIVIANAQNTGKSNAVSLGINIPIPEFSKSNGIGIGADYSWTNHRFGLMSKKPKKAIGFILNTGVDYYFGEDDVIGGVSYSFSSFTYLRLYGGAIYNPGKRCNINLTAGPALAHFSGISEFWWGVNLSGSYYVSEKIGITPTINFMKHDISDPLIAVGLKGSFAF